MTTDLMRLALNNTKPLISQFHSILHKGDSITDRSPASIVRDRTCMGKLPDEDTHNTAAPLEMQQVLRPTDKSPSKALFVDELNRRPFR